MTAIHRSGEPLRDPASEDWMDRLLLRDAEEHAGDYIADNGFTARVIEQLPLVGAMPAWRKPAIALLWLIAGVLFAVALPGVATDLARETYRLFSARPFALSTLGFMVVAIGVVTWTAAVFALRRD